jgi:hypothetical protein
MGNTSDALSSPPQQPLSPWVRRAGVAVAIGVLALAGYLRFDAGTPWAGRALVLALWAAAGAGLWRVARRARSEAERRLTRPDGWEEFRREVWRQKRAEWDALRPRGGLRYALITARWLGLLLLAVLYSAAVCAPAALAPAGAPGASAPRFLAWLAALSGVGFGLALGIGWWMWRSAVRGWAAAESAQPRR